MYVPNMMERQSLRFKSVSDSGISCVTEGCRTEAREEQKVIFKLLP